MTVFWKELELFPGGRTAAVVMGCLILAAATVLPIHPAAARGMPGTEIQLDTDGVTAVFSAQSDRNILSISVRVVGPNGFVFEQRIEGNSLHWIPEGDMADGQYQWEAWSVTADAGATMRPLKAGLSPDISVEHFFDPEELLTHVMTGSIQVENALIVSMSESVIQSEHTSSMVVTGTGVGIGTSTPATALHIQRTNNTAEVRVQDTGAFDGQTMFNLINSGHPKFRMQDTSQGSVVWEFRTSGTQGSNERFQVNKIGSGVVEAQFLAGGDLTIAGNLFQSSSRAVKERIVDLEPEQVLARLNELTVHEWSYQRAPDERHLGPMAEDFHAVFGLGGSTKHIAPGDLAGVALAAAKGLAERSATLEAETSALRAENAELRDRLERIEVMLLQEM